MVATQHGEPRQDVWRVAKISVRDLVKSYGEVKAVRGLNFEISEGEIFGLLGPNGAGKTTTLECIIGLREPDQGTIKVCGFDTRTQSDEVKQRIGAQLQATALQDKITVREAIQLFGSFYRHPAKMDQLLEKFSLTEKADARFETLSGGQKQRLAVALALVNEPELLFLDEPTAGLDPQSRRELHGVIEQMRRDGRTVLLTTHYIEEAEQLCDRVAIIDHGQIIATGTPRQLTSKAQALTHITLTTARPLDLEQMRALASVRFAELDGDSCVIRTPKASEAIIELVKFLEAERNELLDLHIEKPSLEDVFIELTGRRIRE